MMYSFEPVLAPTVDEIVIRSAAPEGAAESEPEGRVGAPGGQSDLGGDAPVPMPIELPELGGRKPSGCDDVVATAPTPPSQEELLALAREEGRLEGVDEGRRTEAARLTKAFETVDAMMSSIERAAAAREQDARARMIVLATAIATHLLEREIRVAPEVMSDLVRRAIAEFPVRDTLRVHLNPSDLALLSSGLSDEAGREQLTSGQYVRWVPDPNVRSGGCLVEGRARIVDARVSTTVERICRALIDD